MRRGARLSPRRGARRPGPRCSRCAAEARCGTCCAPLQPIAPPCLSKCSLVPARLQPRAADDGPALQRAINAAAKAAGPGNGKAVLVPEGNYTLRSSVSISSSYVVLRGAGVRPAHTCGFFLSFSCLLSWWWVGMGGGLVGARSGAAWLRRFVLSGLGRAAKTERRKPRPHRCMPPCRPCRWAGPRFTCRWACRRSMGTPRVGPLAAALWGEQRGGALHTLHRAVACSRA